MTIAELLCLLLSLLAICISGTALALLFKVGSGITVKVELPQTAAPQPAPVLPDPQQLEAIQKILDKAEEDQRKNTQSLDALISQVNGIMVGGELDV